MRSQGHTVALFSMANSRGEPTPYDKHFMPYVDFKEESSLWQKVGRAGRAIYSREARRRIRGMIAEFRPDVAHVRNIYHHLSPSILWELKAQNVPVLYHLNDFKLLCPSYNLVDQGQSCEKCKGGRFWHTLPSGCYPGFAPRIALTVEAYFHRWLGTYPTCVNLFLAPSQFVRDKFVEHGWDNNKFAVLPHFQKLHVMQKEHTASDAPMLYCGRLSAEKGVDDLLRSMQQVPHLRLIVAGEGPQRAELQKLAVTLGLANVEFMGQVGAAERDFLIAKSRFTVLPSRAYETLGKTILESYAEGRAVVASDTGSRRELVHEGETGLLYRTGDTNALAAALGSLASKPDLAERMGQTGHDMVRDHHTPEGHYGKLMGIYANLIAEKRRKSGALIGTTEPAPWERPGSTRRPAPASMSVAPLVLPILPSSALSPKNLRVAFIGGRGVIAKYSGIESYYEKVGKRLAQMGHEVTIYCRSYFTPPLPQHNNMRLVRLPTIRSKHLETLVHTLLSTAHAMTQRYDVVHYHALGPALFSSLPRLAGARTAVTVQGLDWQRQKWGRVASAVLRLGERASVKLPNATMVVSQVLQRRYRENHGVEAFYVPNGGMLRERRKPNKIFDWDIEAQNYLLFLGRFSPEKCCHLLVEAFERLDTGVKLVMAGASSYCDDYSRKLRTHASERIRMLDWVSGDMLDELLTNAMIFVLPSDMEGLSLALLDAMGAGLCVVTSDIPENREVVDGAGFTFQRGNAADLAERLRFLIANPAVREAAGKAAKNRVREKYQWHKITSDIETAYFQMMGLNAVGRAPKKLNASVGGSAERAGRRAG